MSEQVKEVNDSSFEADVLLSKKPVLVDFWAQWCAPCKMMLPTVEAIAKDYAEIAAVVKLNIDDSPETASRYAIKSIPTLILFKDGQEVERVVGTTNKASLARLLDARR